MANDNKIFIARCVDTILDTLKNKRSIYRPFVSRESIEIPGGYRYRAKGDMMAMDGDSIGKIRIEAYQPSDKELPIIVTIDWRRDLYGFWYTDKIFLSNSEDCIEEIDDLLLGILKKIRWVADGSIELRSMNLGYKKTKRDKIKDSTFGYGMVLW